MGKRIVQPNQTRDAIAKQYLKTRGIAHSAVQSLKTSEERFKKAQLCAAILLVVAILEAVALVLR